MTGAEPAHEPGAEQLDEQVSLRRRMLNLRTIGSLLFGVLLLFLLARFLLSPNFDWG